jgi:hypothetical protein
MKAAADQSVEKPITMSAISGDVVCTNTHLRHINRLIWMVTIASYTQPDRIGYKGVGEFYEKLQ